MGLTDRVIKKLGLEGFKAPGLKTRTDRFKE